MRVPFQRAARSLGRHRGYAMAVVTCLALGFGPNVALFAVIDRLLLQTPKGIREPSLLTQLRITRPDMGSEGRSGLSLASMREYEVLRRDSTTFRQLAAYSTLSASWGNASARAVEIVLASGNYFSVLGVVPFLGRLLSDDDDRPKAAAVIVLSHDFWRRTLGADSAIIGSSVQLNGRSFTVVGVAGSSFNGLALSQPVAWVALHQAAAFGLSEQTIRSPMTRWLGMVVRREPNQTARDLLSRGNLLLRQQAEDISPTATSFGVSGVSTLSASRMAPALGDERRHVPMWLLGLGISILLIACANAACLFMMRTESRKPEIAVRLALGADRSDIVTELGAESILLSIVGAAAATLLAHWASALMSAVGVVAVSVTNLRVVVFVAALVALANLLCAIPPALHAARVHPHTGIRALSAGVIGRSRALASLVVIQLALTQLLLLVAFLYARSFVNLRLIDPGLRVDRVLIANIDLRGRTWEAYLSVQREVLERLRASTSLESASFAAVTPFGVSITRPVDAPADSKAFGAGTAMIGVNFVDGEYFLTVGVVLTEGRSFTPADRDGASRVAVVNEFMARSFWPGESAIGKCFGTGGASRCDVRIVGVVRDSRYRMLNESPQPFLYVPIEQAVQLPSLVLHVRARRTPADAARLLPPILADADSSLRYVTVQPMGRIIEQQIAPWRTAVRLVTLVAVLAGLLAASGVYAVVSYSVARRSREIGLRMALGATSTKIRNMVFVDSLRLLAVAVGVGLGAAIAVSRVLVAQLYGIGPLDAFALLTAAAGVSAIAVIATYQPAQRACRNDPMEAMRLVRT